MINLSQVVTSMTYGQRYLCIASMSKDFLPNKEYPVQYDEEGYVYIEDENLERVYTDEDTVGAYVTFKLVTPGEVFKASKQVLPTFELNKEKTMSPSKIQETIQRLNGLTPAQARLTELRQVSSHVQTIQLDLAHLLMTSESVKELKAGEKCLVKGLSVDPHSSVVTLTLSVGDVAKEETEAVRVALEELIKPKA